jgi:hypothetical protein
MVAPGHKRYKGEMSLVGPCPPLCEVEVSIGTLLSP